MRVNVYAEEMTERVDIIAKVIDGHTFTGLRFYLELPATVKGRDYLRRALNLLDQYYEAKEIEHGAR